VVAGPAPEDYRDPAKFFARTRFTRALREHAGMVLRRSAGKTEHTAPVLTLITQFGGGKAHTLTALYDLVRRGTSAADDPGVTRLLQEADLSTVPEAKVPKREAWPEPEPIPVPGPGPQLEPGRDRETIPGPEPEANVASQTVTLRLAGTVPPEIWNRLGTKVIPKLRSGADLTIGISFSVTLNAEVARSAMSEFRQILTDLGLEGRLKIEQALSSSA
jgi:hypothetical protein